MTSLRSTDRSTKKAALFVETDGVYFGLEDVEPWDETRNALLYPGPYRVIAHPPCQRWGRYWHGGPSVKVRKIKGDDGGCFASALASVREWGGVLEHPAHSHAWSHFGITRPPAAGGWVVADGVGGWTCHVKQGHYGHPARKATWLYAVGCQLHSLIWGPSAARGRLDGGFHSTAERKVARAAGVAPVKRLSKNERVATPIAFRDLLLQIVG